MEIYCRVTPTGFVPLTDMDWQAKNKLHIGSDVKLSLTRPRNIRFHRKFFALLNLIVDNLPHPVADRLGIYTTEAMLSAIKIDLGYYETHTVAGREVVRLRSISFSHMDADEFERFYDLAVTDILNNYLIGTRRADLLQEVEDFISQHH